MREISVVLESTSSVYYMTHSHSTISINFTVPNSKTLQKLEIAQISYAVGPLV